MIDKIEMLPTGVYGVTAGKKITKEDYEKVIVPMLEEALRVGDKISFLYRIQSDFDSFTAGAAWEDFKIGLHYLRLFRKCAVVTDTKWIRESAKFFGAMIPCQTRTYKDSEYDKAVGWLAQDVKDDALEYKFLYEQATLIIEPKGPLGSQNFEWLSSVVDPWIEKHGALQALVIHTKKFPGWENLGSAFHHLKFVKAHHRNIRKVAIAADGAFAEIIPTLATHFVEAEIKHFEYDDLDDAAEWAKANTL